jgi:hypothetical protein
MRLKDLKKMCRYWQILFVKFVLELNLQIYFLTFFTGIFVVDRTHTGSDPHKLSLAFRY